jgi:hypothetical protein
MASLAGTAHWGKGPGGQGSPTRPVSPIGRPGRKRKGGYRTSPTGHWPQRGGDQERVALAQGFDPAHHRASGRRVTAARWPRPGGQGPWEAACPLARYPGRPLPICPRQPGALLGLTSERAEAP